MIKSRYYIETYGSKFVDYPASTFKPILKELGFKNIREAYNYGWRNQVKVATFSSDFTDEMYVKLEEALKDYSVHIRCKNW